jgi:hypothetical protein
VRKGEILAFNHLSTLSGVYTQIMVFSVVFQHLFLGLLKGQRTCVLDRGWITREALTLTIQGEFDLPLSVCPFSCCVIPYKWFFLRAPNSAVFTNFGMFLFLRTLFLRLIIWTKRVLDP